MGRAGRLVARHVCFPGGHMHDVMRRRLWRKLEALPDEQLYQVLDFIEFLESKYAPGKAAEPTGLQKFAERVEDHMRERAIAPRIMKGALGLLGTAGRMLDGIAGAGRELLDTVTGGDTGTNGTQGGARNGVARPRPAEPPVSTAE